MAEFGFLKSLYGAKQTAKNWGDSLAKTLCEYGLFFWQALLIIFRLLKTYSLVFILMIWQLHMLLNQLLINLQLSSEMNSK